MEGWTSWSGYRRETVSSSRSGTIVSGLSTGYTSSGSRFSTSSVEAAMHFHSLGIHEELELGIHEDLHLGVHEELELGIHEDLHLGFHEEVDGDNLDGREEAEEEEEETREDRIIRLVQELFSAPSANCSIKRDDTSVLERWVILSRASSGKELGNDVQSWIRSLHEIAEIISFTRLHLPDGTKLPIICEEQGKHVGVRCIPGPCHLALVIQETMLKILSFADILVAWDLNTTEDFLSMDGVMLPSYNKLISLLGVHDALSRASYKILTQINRSTCAEVRRIENEMSILLSEYANKLDKAIWSTKEKIRMTLMEIPVNPQGSSDIHKVTQSVMTCMRLMHANYSLVDSVICGQYVLCHMIMEMVSCVEEKLANISESFPDQGLSSLFLLNNSYYMLEQLNLHFDSPQQSAVSSDLSNNWLCTSSDAKAERFVHPLSKQKSDLSEQIEGHMDRYLRVSWAPLLSCLFNPTPLCLGKSYSPLSKFESEFQKICSTQMEWKVPDPELRRKLRQAISDKIIPGYTQYIEDKKVTRPKISPEELKAKLQEIFEG